MKFKSKITALILAITLPLAQTGFAMQNAQANNQQAPDVIGMIKNVWGWMQENPIKSTAIGGVAAFVLYQLMTGKKGKKRAPRNVMRNEQAPHANAGQGNLQQEIAYLAQHAQRAMELFETNKLPKAYLYGKYCEIAKRSGFASLPVATRKALANASLAYDLAFSGYDLQTKTNIGIQAAMQKAITQLNQAIQAAIGYAGNHNPQAQSTGERDGSRQQAQSTNFGFQGIFQAFMDRFRANPLGTIGLILSSGYSLLAQLNGWWPHGAAQATPATGPQPAPAPAPAPTPPGQPGLGVD